jgi:hypothetical protein|tara:strand:+ start:194 stop:373 length:180 start_codon:yes stop_codon:yes gene_type:complete
MVGHYLTSQTTAFSRLPQALKAGLMPPIDAPPVPHYKLFRHLYKEAIHPALAFGMTGLK